MAIAADNFIDQDSIVKTCDSLWKDNNSPHKWLKGCLVNGQCSGLNEIDDLFQLCLFERIRYDDVTLIQKENKEKRRGRNS